MLEEPAVLTRGGNIMHGVGGHLAEVEGLVKATVCGGATVAVRAI